MNLDFYRGKRVFITGASGFVGSWLCLWLKQLGAEVCGYSLEPNTTPSMFLELGIDKQIENIYGSILDKKKVKKAMQKFKPDILFHLAAQPFVRYSYAEPVLTYETNVLGTINVLNAAFKTPSIKSFVTVTSEKCYKNTKKPEYNEGDQLGGKDMYSSSRACGEIMSESFRVSFLQGGKMYSMATARTGKIFGGGDWTLDRLIPDCIRAIVADKPLGVRNSTAQRPWQFILDPILGYLILAQKLFEDGANYASAFNFGPERKNILNVEEVARRVCKIYGKGQVVLEGKSLHHESNMIMLNTDKARSMLGWTPIYDVDTAIEKTVQWYKKFYSNTSKEEMLNYTLNQIEEYQSKALS